MAVDALKTIYARGTQVCLCRMHGRSRLIPGTLGTVQSVDEAGMINVAWDDGSTMPLDASLDYFRIVRSHIA